jgi:hypothetical protein
MPWPCCSLEARATIMWTPLAQEVGVWRVKREGRESADAVVARRRMGASMVIYGRVIWEGCWLCGCCK